jgi:hypothetical protein
MTAEIGIVITNRDRPRPLRNCLVSLAAQNSPPAWVAIADLGSSDLAANELELLAESFGVSCLHIGYDGPWNQALAFNTALRYMPPVSHVVQLDADMMLHPYLLTFTQRGLTTVNALCCVPSYLSSVLVPVNYDGGWNSFRQLLSLAYGGNKLSRGGFVCLPRDWLIENRGYDEAYSGWGFEDADLWWRAEQQLTTYVEESGSLLLHQSHTRQSGATLGEANPNLRRYQMRECGVPLPVSPAGFGQGPVRAAQLRLGIRSSSPVVSPDAMAGCGLSGVPLRTRQQGRLRPTPKADMHARSDFDSISLDEVIGCAKIPHTCPEDGHKISIMVLLNQTAPSLVSASLASLTRQSVEPNQIMLIDCGEFPVSTEKYLKCALQFAKCDVIRGNGLGTRLGNTIEQALRYVDSASVYLLIVSESVIFHPRMLELLLSLQIRGPSLVYGRTHAVPPIAAEIAQVAGVPWEAWGSVAHLELHDFGWWHFGRKSWIEEKRLYDREWNTEQFQPETIRKVSGIGSLSLIRLPDDLVVCYSCPRPVDI